MPKQCILINGTMGVGKTTVCKELDPFFPEVFFWTAIGVGTAIRLLLPKILKRWFCKILVSYYAAF